MGQALINSGLVLLVIFRPVDAGCVGGILIDRRKVEKPGDESGFLRSLFSEGYFRGAGSTITDLAHESAVSADIGLEDITYGIQRVYPETHR